MQKEHIMDQAVSAMEASDKMRMKALERKLCEIWQGTLSKASAKGQLTKQRRRD